MKEITYKKTYILLALFFLIGLIIMGYSYAYTHARIYNKEITSTIIANGAIMEITYNDPESGIETTPTIIANGIIPGWSASKKFTITGKNTAENLDESEKMIYKIGLVIESNTFSEGAINYMLSNDETPDNGLAVNDSRGVVAKTGTQWIGKGYFNQTSLNAPAIHKYTLTISFPETDINQSADKNKSLKLYVTIEGTNDKSEFAFELDSWETIAANVRDGNTSRYNVGDTKCVKIEGITPPIVTGCNNGKFAVRLVNKSTPSECNTEGYSQTACGFVIEFTSIIELHNMNPAGTYNGTNYPYGWNIGGWPDSKLYKYVNGTKDGNTWDRSESIFSKLDPNLQNVIADTYTVSGHGPTAGEQNFESTDKLYLLSSKEIYGNCGDGTNGTTNCRDTATTVTRQLDWYNADIESGRTQVTTSNYGSSLINTPIKYYQIQKRYWLRSASSNFNYGFSSVGDSGYRYDPTANGTGGIAPAFRIG